MHRHSRHVPIARPGGPKHNEEVYHIFVTLWAIYNSKRTKTPEDTEQINITNNTLKTFRKIYGKKPAAVVAGILP